MTCTMQLREDVENILNLQLYSFCFVNMKHSSVSHLIRKVLSALSLLRSLSVLQPHAC